MRADQNFQCAAQTARDGIAAGDNGQIKLIRRVLIHQNASERVRQIMGVMVHVELVDGKSSGLRMTQNKCLVSLAAAAAAAEGFVMLALSGGVNRCVCNFLFNVFPRHYKETHESGGTMSRMRLRRKRRLWRIVAQAHKRSNTTTKCTTRVGVRENLRHHHAKTRQVCVVCRVVLYVITMMGCYVNVARRVLASSTKHHPPSPQKPMGVSILTLFSKTLLMDRTALWLYVELCCLQKRLFTREHEHGDFEKLRLYIRNWAISVQ